MVENTSQYLEKTEIEGFGGNLFLYKRLENANADSKDIWHYRKNYRHEDYIKPLRYELIVRD